MTTTELDQVRVAPIKLIRIHIAHLLDTYLSTPILTSQETHIEDTSTTMETDASNIPLPTNEDLSPTEQDLLDEYERLAENMKTVRFPSFTSPSQ
jgi:hypothetical protein